MRKLLSLILVTAFCFGTVSFTGCSGGNEGESIESSVSESETPALEKLKIGSYNIKNGAMVYHDFKVLADDIVKNDLDIVGLQEVDRLCKRSKFMDTMELLKEYTGMQYYAYFKCIDLEGDEAKYGEKGAYGIAILSKYPILETEEIELNDGSQVERRLLAHAKIDINGTVINFFNTHLTIQSDAIREKEFEIVANTVKNAEKCILVGDFNVDTYQEFEILKPLSYINNPDTDYITHPEGDRKIDNICYSSEFSLLENSHGIYQNYHSDHVLLYAELEMNIE